jgi:hypothetical protein
MTKTEANRQARALKAYNKMVKFAIANGFVASVEAFETSKHKEILIGQVGRAMSRRLGQGWSR